MKYTVHWKATAQQRLAEIWLAAQDQQSVADAADRIDMLLRNNPEGVGESRDGNARILLVPPLGADYRVHPADQQVNVLAVWKFGPPAQP